MSFILRRYENKREIASEVWRIKDQNQGGGGGGGGAIQMYHGVSSSTIQDTIQCTLCLSKKLHILGYKGDNLLNECNKIISKCRHQNKFLLANIKCVCVCVCV